MKRLKRVKQKYKIEFTENFDEYVKQLDNTNFEDLSNIIQILDIESDWDYTNVNRYEAVALTLWEILRKNFD